MAKQVLALLLLALVTCPGCSSAGRLSGSSAAARPPAAVSDASIAARPLVDVSNIARQPMTVSAAPPSSLDNSPAATRAVYSYLPRRPAGWFCCGAFCCNDCCNGYRPRAITVPTSSVGPRPPVAVSEGSTAQLEDSDSPAAVPPAIAD